MDALDPRDTPKPQEHSAGLSAGNDVSGLKDGPTSDQVFTKPAIARFMLDLAGYTIGRKLHTRRFVDPAAGPGVFVLAAIERLIADARLEPVSTIAQLRDAIRAVEIDHRVLATLRTRVRELLLGDGFAPSDAQSLAETWCVAADYLDLSTADWPADYIVGNPPYRRYDDLRPDEQQRFRADFSTFSGRCDIYVAFFERALSLLKPGGVMAFITPDRWLRTQYGSKMRALISERYHLRMQIDVTEQRVFTQDVSAYPGITVIENGVPGPTRLTKLVDVAEGDLGEVARTLSNPVETKNAGAGRIYEFADFATGKGPWLGGDPEQVALANRLMRTFPGLHDVGCRIGNGVATGANAVYISKLDSKIAAAVEPEFWVPTVIPRDLSTGDIVWSGRYLLNVWGADNKLIDPVDHPGLANYLQAHREQLCNRYIARRNPMHWYRTIDRVRPELPITPKLLLADIQSTPQFALDDGTFYPRNGVYYITSERWPLAALRMVLESGLARLILAGMTTTVRGGSFRCQAQYLNRIPIVAWDDVPHALQQALVEAARAGRQPRPALVGDLFGLSASERAVVERVTAAVG